MGGGALSDVIAAAILGLVQGITEFLPISSTAHLILVTRMLGLDPARYGLSFDIALHLGTALAVLLYFLPVWLGLLRDVLRGRFRLPLLIAVGTVPGVIAGVLLESTAERELRGSWPIAAGLVGGSLAFWLAERIGRDARERGLAGTTFIDVIVIGLAQAVALVPGVSRSGITISAGLFRGLARPDAARLSFLFATPITLGAVLKTAFDARRASELFAHPDTLAIGFVVSFLAGLGTVALLMRFVRTHSLTWFVPYRLVLALAVLVSAAAGA